MLKSKRVVPPSLRVNRPLTDRISATNPQSSCVLATDCKFDLGIARLSLAQYFGHYSYGHQGGRWKKNKVHNNIGYGFDPHDDSDHLLIKENEVCVCIYILREH